MDRWAWSHDSETTAIPTSAEEALQAPESIFRENQGPAIDEAADRPTYG